MKTTVFAWRGWLNAARRWHHLGCNRLVIPDHLPDELRWSSDPTLQRAAAEDRPAIH
jgi:hypothetical protein